MSKEESIGRGIVAGIAGGLVAAWVMNQFMAGPGQKLVHAVQSDEENFMQDIAACVPESEPKEDATMKTADAIVHAATGGRHLSWEQKQKAGPVVHYAFGALMGGLYGGAAECAPAVTAAYGTTFGSLLFSAADLIAVPAFHLSPPEENKLSPKLLSPFAAHLVYGATTEVVRRLVRNVL